jgi:hypothetical protein
MRPKELHSEISAALEGDRDAAGHIVRPLLAFHAIIRQRGLTPDEILEGVRYGVKASKDGWSETELERWGTVEPFLGELLQMPAVRLVATALDLSYEYQNLLQGARIVTDIRPVFNADADGIEGAVVSHTLRIRYDNTEGDHSLSIAMDINDIRELERQCKRALKKAETAQALMRERTNIPTIISGEGADEEM